MPDELMLGDCWIGLILAQENGLILAVRVGKHTAILTGFGFIVVTKTLLLKEQD